MSTEILKDNLTYFKNVASNLDIMSNDYNGSTLVDLFGKITNHVATLSDNFNFPDSYDPTDAINGDNGDIEDGADMLFYYQQLVRDGDYDTSNTNVIYSYFVGGSKIKHDDYLYVNHIADEDEPADVEPETASMLKDDVVNDIIFDLKETLKAVNKNQLESKLEK